jgi:uncharacterized protein YoxC
MDVIELWWFSLALFALVVVVVAVLLGLIIAAAKSIDRHAAAIWVAGKQIAGNTVSIWMLEQADQLLRETQREAERLQKSAASMDEHLRAVAGASGGRR